jgi:DNA-binding NarL/FixJ family response regulator
MSHHHAPSEGTMAGRRSRHAGRPPRGGGGVPMRADGARTGVIRVLVAGGEALMRASVSAVLGTGNGMVVIGEAATDDEAIALARETRPDVILMDGADGLHVLSTTRRLLADPELAAVQVLMLGRFEREEDVLAALRSGIAGLIDRDVPPYELVRAVLLSATGDTFVMPASMRRLAGRLETSSARRPQEPDTTRDPDTHEE